MPTAPALLDHHLDLIVRVADRHARWIARQLDLGADHRDDLRQQLLADLLERLGAFNGTSPFTAFARLVMRHQAATLAQRYVRELRRPLVAIDAVPDDDPDALDRLIANRNEADSQGLPADLRADLDRVLARLPTELRQICVRLAADTTAEAAARYGGASRATFYRRLGDLRLELLTYDLRPAA